MGINKVEAPFTLVSSSVKCPYRYPILGSGRQTGGTAEAVRKQLSAGMAAGNVCITSRDTEERGLTNPSTTRLSIVYNRLSLVCQKAISVHRLSNTS